MTRSVRSTCAAFTFALAGSALAVGLTGWARAQDETKPPAGAVRPVADEAETKADPDAATPAAPKTVPPYRRVPSHFGMVGLSDQQRADIYAIRGRFQAEIAELERQLEGLKRREVTECESVLTESQLKLLNQLRDARRPPASSGEPG